MSGRRIAFWALFAVTAAIYATMLVWSLPAISAKAGGLAPFDMRPGGYTFDDAHTFLSALTPEGAAFYRNVQQRLDLFFPALVALTMFFAIAALLPTLWGGWRWLLASVALPGAVFDYLENAGVAAMLAAGPDGLTAQLVDATSRWSMLKAAANTVASVLLLVLVFVGLWRWLAARRSAPRTTV